MSWFRSKSASAHLAMEEEPKDLSPPQDLRTYVEIKKLRLEIENLSKKNRWELYLQFLPMVTTAVAVSGLVLGTFSQSQEARNKERTKLQDQITSTQEEIFKFAPDKNQTLSRVSFLLARLSDLMGSEPGQEEQTKTFTANLVQMISDLDMENSSRDDSFPLVALTHWSDYKRHLGENPADLELILRQYVQAIRNMRDKKPDYLRTIRYEKDQFVFFEEHFKEPSQLRRFREIYGGFAEHLKLTASNQSLCAQMLREFKLGLGNENLAYEIWENEPKNNPCGK